MGASGPMLWLDYDSRAHVEFLDLLAIFALMLWFQHWAAPKEER